MGSLRTQFVLLIAVALLAALWMLGLYAARSARHEFTASVQALAVEDGIKELDGLQEAYGATGWPGVAAVLERSSSVPSLRRALVLDAQDRIVIDPTGIWDGARVSRDAENRLRVRVDNARATAALVLAGGLELRDADGTVAGRVFPGSGSLGNQVDPTTERELDVFESALSRRVRYGAFLIVLVSVGLTGVAVSRLLSPLQRLRSAAMQVSSGDLDVRVGAVGPQEVRDVAHAFDEMVDSLRRSEAQRERMIRDVAHELRTPLTILKGQIESMQDGLRPPDAAALASLHEEVGLLERLTDDLAELARADQGLLSVDLQSVPVGPLVEETTAAFVRAGRIPADAVTVERTEELRVQADPERLRQILRNVLDNAVRHGGADVRIDVRVAGVGQAVAVSVRDTGSGISPGHLPHVTERLYRVDPARGRDGGGSGVGLAIVESLMKAMNGSVAVESTLGEGTEVVLRLRRTASEVHGGPALQLRSGSARPPETGP